MSNLILPMCVQVISFEESMVDFSTMYSLTAQDLLGGSHSLNFFDIDNS